MSRYLADYEFEVRGVGGQTLTFGLGSYTKQEAKIKLKLLKDMRAGLVKSGWDCSPVQETLVVRKEV